MRFFAAAFALVLAPGESAQAPKQLTIVKPTLRQYEGGPPITAGGAFNIGDSVFFDFQILGYQVSPEAKIDLAYRIEAVDPQGVPIEEAVEREIRTEVSPQDKEWMPIVRHGVGIPPLALPGVYRVLISVEDRLAGREAKTVLDVPVRGRDVQPGEAIVARNFRFLRGEEDRNPLTVAAYRPGDSLWARFEITGFRYGENNRVHVEYGIAVVGPGGNVMFSEPQAAVEQGESFYPKKYLPGILSLNLDGKVQAGEYAVVLTLRDRIGDQAEESRHEFRVQ